MFETLPGFREFYPDACALRNFLFARWRDHARRFGFLEYDAPLLEPLELFTEKSGEEVVRQLFDFTDKGERRVALRPEMTPSLARLVGCQANSIKRPVKWFNIGEHFRYEKPQKGRTRSFYQFNADILGEPGAGADAELISLCASILRGLGMKPHDFIIRLSDRDLWIYYLAAYGIENQAAVDVLSIIDKMEREPEEVTREKLQKGPLGDRADAFYAEVKQMTELRSIGEMRDFFSKGVAGGAGTDAAASASERIVGRLAEWESLLAYLDSMAVTDSLRIDLGIVRGLAYYTGFVFEVFESTGQNRALAGGGRYDNLVAKLGYPAMPAAGFAMGDVTLTDSLRERELLPPIIHKPDIYCVLGGETERREALRDISILREGGLVVDYPYKQTGFGKQFKLAGNSGARLALIYGESELAEGAVKLRDLESGNEKSVPRQQLAMEIQRVFEEGWAG